MKKKSIMIIVFCIILIICTVFLFLLATKKTDPESTKKTGTLVIGSRNISNDSFVIYKDKKKEYAQLPLLVVSKEIGIDIEFESANKVLMTYNGKKCILDFNLKTLCEDGNTDNYLAPPPGITTYICIFEDNDVLIDNITLRAFFFMFDVPFAVHVDYDYQTITLVPAPTRSEMYSELHP